VVVEFLRLGVGQCFGELALITGLPRTAAAVVNEPTVLLKLKRENFTRIMDEYQNLRFHVMGLVEHRLEETQRVDTEVNKRAASPYRASRANSTSNLLADCMSRERYLFVLIFLFFPAAEKNKPHSPNVECKQADLFVIYQVLILSLSRPSAQAERFAAQEVARRYATRTRIARSSLMPARKRNFL
jgi:CRP-like cAMP-binding protein